MGHLRSEELIDLAEGTRPEASAGHLQSCESCRRQLADLRAMLAAAAEVSVPEPSPLFWDHLSARVHEAVADERGPRRELWSAGWPRLAMALPLGAFAIAIAAAVVTMRLGHAPGHIAPRWCRSRRSRMRPRRRTGRPARRSVARHGGRSRGAGGLGRGRAGPRDARGYRGQCVIGQLTAGERRELQRLLKEELTRPGA